MLSPVQSSSNAIVTPPMPPKPPKGKKPKNHLASFCAATTAGVSEIMVFHPADTMGKRIQYFEGKSSGTNTTVSQKLRSLNDVIFRDKASLPLYKRWGSLYPGLGFATGYKVLQRTYKFGTQPLIKEGLNQTIGNNLKNSLGQKNGNILLGAVAGSAVGIGEVALLPLDVLKIRSQTNAAVLKGRGLIQLFKEERFGLYKGWQATIARNAPGSFFLFGGNAATYEYMFGLKDHSQATLAQNFTASCVGSFFSIAGTNPQDVIKTRLQARGPESTETGLQLVGQILKKEGPRAFFKGLGPKLPTAGLKVSASFTVFKSLYGWFDRQLSS